MLDLDPISLGPEPQPLQGVDLTSVFYCRKKVFASGEVPPSDSDSDTEDEQAPLLGRPRHVQSGTFNAQVLLPLILNSALNLKLYPINL